MLIARCNFSLLHLFRNDEGCTVFPTAQGIGLGAVGEFLGLGVIGQGAPQLARGVGHVDLGCIAQVPFDIVKGFAHHGVVTDGLRRFLKGDLLAQAVGRVAQVDEGCGAVSFDDLCGEVFPFPAADAVDEVPHVGGALFGGIEQGRVVDGHAVALAVGEEFAIADHPFVGVIFDGDFPIFLFDQSAGLVDQLDLATIKDGQMGVGCLALIFIAKAAPEAEHAFRRGPFGHGQAADIQIVGAEITDFAIAEVPPPVPAVMDQIGPVFLLGRRAQVEVEVQLGRRRFGLLDAVARPGAAIIGIGGLQFAVLAVADIVGQLDPLRVGAPLRAVLHEAVVLPGGGDDLAAFEEVVAAWFFDVDIFTGLAAPDSHEGVPVVGRHDGDGVEILVLQRPAHILDAGRRVIRLAGDIFTARGKQAAIGIDEVGDLHILHAAESRQKAAAPAMDARHGNAHAVIGAHHTARGFRAGNGKGGGEAGRGGGPF